MIARHIKNNKGQDNYRALALYAADASMGKTQGEKTLHSWFSGGESDNYLEAMIEVEATQALNTRTKKPKTYHLMVSFNPEDEAKLNPEVFQKIEQIFAKALGFSSHQRHCGVHQNTDNMHIHIAYNMIDPKTFNRNVPFFDFFKLSMACRKIEKKYGFKVDKGMKPDHQKKDGVASDKVKSIEAQTGQESLFSYILGHKPKIMEEINKSKNWQDVHKAFLTWGLILQTSGNGLTIKDRFGKHYAKPSQISRELSRNSLSKIFGDFEEFSKELFHSIETKKTYTAKPIQVASKQSELYEIFQDEMLKRKSVLADIKEESALRYGEIKDKWKEKRAHISLMPMLKHDRQRILLESRQKEQEEFAQMRLEISEKRNQIRAELPYTSWNKCLQHKAALGNEAALAILRSKNEEIPPEVQEPYINAVETAVYDRKWLDKKQEILKAVGVSGKHKQALLAVLRMEELLSKEIENNESIEQVSHTIDTKGTIVFKLAHGGTIRDTGKEIHFSAHNEKVKKLAENYAQLKWGNMSKAENSVIKILTSKARMKNQPNLGR